MDRATLCVKTPVIVNNYKRWIEIMSLYRYTDIKEDIAEELENLRDEGKALENVRKVHSRFFNINFQIRNCQKEFPRPRRKKYFPFSSKFMSWRLTKFS